VVRSALYNIHHSPLVESDTSGFLNSVHIPFSPHLFYEQRM